MGLNFASELELMFAGLDLAAGGKDLSALALVEVYELPTGERRGYLYDPEEWEVTEPHYVVKGLHQWPRGTDPGDVLRSVATLLDGPEFAACRLLYDGTGLGYGVRSISRDLRNSGHFSCGVEPVIITGGQQSEVGIPKIDLVSGLSRLVHEGRLHLTEGPLTKVWRKQMDAFQAKVTAAGNVKYEAQTEAVHDDLVIAVALAVSKRRHTGWSGRQVPRAFFNEHILGLDPAQIAAPAG